MNVGSTKSSFGVKEVGAKVTTPVSSLIEKFDGVCKVAGLALSVFKLIKCFYTGEAPETINIVTAQAEAIQEVDNSFGIVGVLHGIFTKPFEGGFLVVIKRITFIGVSILGVNSYLSVIKVTHCTTLLIKFAGVSLSQIFLIFGMTLNIIENSISLWNNDQGIKKLKNKKIELLKNTPEVIQKVIEKLEVGIVSLKKELKDTNELELDNSQRKIKLLTLRLNALQDQLGGTNPDDKDACELLAEKISAITNKMNKHYRILKISNLRHLAHHTLTSYVKPSEEMSRGELTRLKGYALAIKLLKNTEGVDLADVEVLLNRPDAYMVYKTRKYAVREANLALDRNKNCWKIGCNVALWVSMALGIGGAVFGVKAIVNVIRICSEDTYEKGKAMLSIFAGTIGIHKYLLEKEEAKVELGVAAACAA